MILERIGQQSTDFLKVPPRVSATFDVGRDDGLGSRRNPLGETLYEDLRVRDLLSVGVQPVDLHLVNVGSIPTGTTHGDGSSTAAPWGRA